MIRKVFSRHLWGILTLIFLLNSLLVQRKYVDLEEVYLDIGFFVCGMLLDMYRYAGKKMSDVHLGVLCHFSSSDSAKTFLIWPFKNYKSFFLKY